MENPPNILSYATGSAINQEQGKLIFRPASAAWEMALFVVLIMFSLVGAILILAVVHAKAADDVDPRYLGSAINIAFAVALVWFAWSLIKEIARRQKWGHLPIVILRKGQWIVLDFPASRGANPVELEKENLFRFIVRRRGWSLRLQPVYELRVRHLHRLTDFKRAMIMGSHGDNAKTIEARLSQLLQDTPESG